MKSYLEYAMSLNLSQEELFGLLFNVQVTIFQSCWDGATASWVFTSSRRVVPETKAFNCIEHKPCYNSDTIINQRVKDF